MGAHCHVLDADGTLRLNRFGRPTVRTLLFPANEATLLDTWQTIGLRLWQSRLMLMRQSQSCTA